MSQPSPLCVGIDVSKATLDLAASSAIEQFSVCNDADGFDLIIAELLNVVAMNTLLSLITSAVRSDRAESGVVWRRDVYLDRQTLGVSRRCSRSVCEKASGLGNVVLTRQQTHHESAGNGMGNARQASRSNVPQRSGQSLYEQAVPAVAVAIPDQAEYEPAWKLLV